QFYDWERRGRGWNLYDVPVDLEPEFVPFFFHYTSNTSVIDDGKRPTLVSKLFDFFSSESPSQTESNVEKDIYAEINAYTYENDEPLNALRISLPKGYKIKIGEM